VTSQALGVEELRKSTFTDGFGALTPGVARPEGSTFGSWTAVWDGGGTIEPGADLDLGPTLALAPAVATTPSTTHSALVVSVPTFGDTDLTMMLRTRSQLRRGSPPNPWEVAWAAWHFTDNRHFYYLILKPNGWELGKADPAYPGAQRFLATASDPTFPIGAWHTVHITQVGASITLAADGRLLTTFVDDERPYLEGSIALYCEDSAVDFGPLTASGRR
jgi:hypothetical protein